MNELVETETGGFSAAQVRAQVNRIQEVMKAVMMKDVHYGVIPGTPKPTLYKAGAEKLLFTFRIAADHEIEDLSTADEARFRITAKGTSIQSGKFLGSGVGEASTAEEKYSWRKIVSNKEFEATPEDRKRIKYTRDGEIEQVRTNIADVRNTVLKMAVKRAYVALALNVTAASDIFAQDIEDLPEEVREAVTANGTEPPLSEPKAKAPPAATKAEKAPANAISDPQAKRLYAIWKSSGISEKEYRAYLKDNWNVEDTRKISRDDYEAIVSWVEKHKVAA